MFEQYSNLLLVLALIVAAAMFARWLADRCRQPSVMGELLLGVLIGNVGYRLGYPLFGLIMHLDSADRLVAERSLAGLADTEVATNDAASDLPASVVEALGGGEGVGYLATVHALWVLANLGVLLLLFMVGLESSVEKMRRVRGRAAAVAGIGIAAPFFLGFAFCYWLHPGMELPGHLFLAAALSATSVGITARVFEDLNKLHSDEAEVILGAAIIDDILGLVLLAVAASIASTGLIDLWPIVRITFVASVFLGLVLTVGERVVSWGARQFQRLDSQNAALLYPLSIALLMSWMADAIHLAPIIGAFAAGLLLNERQFVDCHTKLSTREQIAPLERFLAPVFFLFTGMQVNLAYFVDFNTVLLAAGFSIAAVLGKVAAGVGAGRDMDRLSIGLGMMPRGEVRLIFLSVGRGLGVISQTLFAALVVAVVVTTLITPPALKWSLCRYTNRRLSE